jgi:YVTN family beta-propeller protein
LKVLDSIKVGQRPLILDMTPDRNFIYVANRNSNSVSVIRTSDHAVVTTILNVGVEPHGVAISRDGMYASVSCENLDGSDKPHHPTAGGNRTGTVAIIDISTNPVIRELEVGNFCSGSGCNALTINNHQSSIGKRRSL